MRARVWRLFREGQAIDRAVLRASRPAEGELVVRLRIGGRDERHDIHLACLMAEDDAYVIPVLDRARLVEVRGTWMRLVGVEVLPHGRSVKRLGADRFPQQWWCRVV